MCSVHSTHLRCHAPTHEQIFSRHEHRLSMSCSTSQFYQGAGSFATLKDPFLSNTFAQTFSLAVSGKLLVYQNFLSWFMFTPVALPLYHAMQLLPSSRVFDPFGLRSCHHCPAPVGGVLQRHGQHLHNSIVCHARCMQKPFVVLVTIAQC